MDITNVFAKNVRKYTRVCNLTQENLAAITGLYRTYICAIENEPRNISLDNIQKIANALNINTYLLFKED